MTYIKTPFPIGKMGKWENGKNVIKTFQRPYILRQTDYGKLHTSVLENLANTT